MDSISNHYAAKRTMPALDSNKRAKTNESDSPGKIGMSRTVSSASVTSINQQVIMARAKPPRPKAAKTAEQQAEDRQRIFNMGTGSAPGGLHLRSRPVTAPGSARKAKGIDISKREQAYPIFQSGIDDTALQIVCRRVSPKEARISMPLTDRPKRP